MYEDYKCVKCGTVEAVEDKVGTPSGNVCIDCHERKDRTDEIIEMLSNAKKDLKIFGFAVYGSSFQIIESLSSSVLFDVSEYDNIVKHIESLYTSEIKIERNTSVVFQSGGTVNLTLKGSR